MAWRALAFAAALLFLVALASAVDAAGVAGEELAAVLSKAELVYDGLYTLYKSKWSKRLDMRLDVGDVEGKRVVVVEVGKVDPLAGRYPEIRVCGDTCSEWVEVYPFRLYEFEVSSISDRIIIELKEWSVPVGGDRVYAVDIRRVWIAPYKPDEPSTVTVTVTTTVAAMRASPAATQPPVPVLLSSGAGENSNTLLLAGLAAAATVAVAAAAFVAVGARRGV